MGAIDKVGICVGAKVGAMVGDELGICVGTMVGDKVGICVDGTCVGVVVCCGDGGKVAVEVVVWFCKELEELLEFSFSAPQDPPRPQARPAIVAAPANNRTTKIVRQNLVLFESKKGM